MLFDKQSQPMKLLKIILAQLLGITYKHDMQKEKMHMVKTVNYDAESTAALIEAYAGGKGLNIPELAAKFVKSDRSIRSKLVREGVYVVAEKGAASTKTDGPSKKELLRFLEEYLPKGFPVDGFLPAKKESLVALIDYFNEEYTSEMTESEEEEARDSM
jgi:hypothetical protein